MSSVRRGVYPPTTKAAALFLPNFPFPLPSPFPFPLPSPIPSIPSPSLPSPPFASYREAAPLKPARGSEEAL